MSFVASTRAELLKTKRTSSVWLSVIGAAFIPSLCFLAYYFKPDGAVKRLAAEPWKIHLFYGWQALNSFLFPMYIVLLCTLIPQIEYRNNTWKQVFSSPQSFAGIYFSKFLIVHFIILFFYLLFNVFMMLSGVAVNLLNDKFTFLQHPVDWKELMRLNFKTYVSVLGISAIQYWLSLRFKSFVAPVGIGLALLISALIAMNMRWEDIYKHPYAHPILTLQYMMKPKGALLENHELNFIVCFLLFTTLGFLDMKYRKEKG